MTHDVSNLLSRRVSESELAKILELVEAQPNLRDRPSPGDVDGQFDHWFDGGACRVETGWVDFEFSDGTVAKLATPIPGLSLEVRFPDGRQVHVQQTSFGVGKKPA